MKYNNFIFSGFGYAAGKFTVTNADIYEAQKKGYFEGFSEEKIKNSEKFKNFSQSHPDASPFDYFAGEIMGFYERHYVRPFPPRKNKMKTETSLELAVKAVGSALQNANIQAKDIDAWFVSTVSPHQQAPGIAGSVKSFFTDSKNYKPAFSLASGCAGFNQNLQKCIEYFNLHKEAKFAVVAHTETMSSFLNERTKFVPFVTFGDAAAAVIVERVESNERFGILSICNFHDLKMLDFVGVDADWNLYMDDTVIKDRACVNIPQAANYCLNVTGLTTNDIDIFVPHQTGNVIVKQAAKELHFPDAKVFLKAQNCYGNVSGATVPLGLSMLAEEGKISEGTKILSATAGVGGNYGGFVYQHKVKQNSTKSAFNFHKDELSGKNVLVLGATGVLGRQVVKELSQRGANLYLQGKEFAPELTIIEAKFFACDFVDNKQVESFVQQLLSVNVNYDFLINLAESTENNSAEKVNFFAPLHIINSLSSRILEGIISVGIASEDLYFDEAFEAWTSSKRAIHGYLASSSAEFAKKGVKIIYQQLGFLESGNVAYLPEKSVFKFMLASRQEHFIKVETAAEAIVNSLYIPCQLGVEYNYESFLRVGRMGYDENKKD